MFRTDDCLSTFAAIAVANTRLCDLAVSSSAAMAANLVKSGHTITVGDFDPDRARRLAEEHEACATTALNDLADCRFVITMLPSGKDVREALLHAEDGGVAAHLQPGAIAIDMSSAEPVGTRAIGEALAKSDIGPVDAPSRAGFPAPQTVR